MSTVPVKHGPFSNRADLDRKLGSEKNALNSELVKVRRVRNGQLYTGGRTSADLPEFLREAIGTCAIINGSGPTAAAFGVSRGTAQGAQKGTTGYGQSHHENPDLKKKMDLIKGGVVDVALTKLMASVNVISEEALSGLGPVKQAQVASSLAGVVERLSEKKENGAVINAGVIVYAPAHRAEQEYTTIEVVSEG